MATEHTKGPWVTNRNMEVIEVEYSTPIQRIAFIDPLGRGRSEEAKANACLIAAAPELLEAARGALHTLDDGRHIADASESAVIDALRAVIDKATA